MTNKVFFAQPWGGLGDNLQFTTLPKLFSEKGIDFFLSQSNTYRNSEIYDFCWAKNPYVKGVSNNFAKYEYQYKSINDLREHYFDKFSDSEYINYASLGNIFKYFDNIMSSILYDIVPSKVRFEGFNFVYESHVLERSKYEFKNKDSINSISSSINVPTNEGIIPDSFLNYSRENTRSRRSTSYTIDRKHST